MGCGDILGGSSGDPEEVGMARTIPLHGRGPDLAEGDEGGRVFLGDAAAGTRAGPSQLVHWEAHFRNLNSANSWRVAQRLI